MKKTMHRTRSFTVCVAIAASTIVACPALFADQTLYYWANTNGGNWTATANWVMEDGTGAADAPRLFVRPCTPSKLSHKPKPFWYNVQQLEQ